MYLQNLDTPLANMRKTIEERAAMGQHKAYKSAGYIRAIIVPSVYGTPS
jgi:hypothetical protein